MLDKTALPARDPAFRELLSFDESAKVPAFFASPARVLLAEDDPAMREMVAGALRLDGYDVIEVPDGGRLIVWVAEAYSTADVHDAFDLIVSDVRMPVCSGLDVLEGLRKARWSTPAILMTAFGDETMRMRAESLGAVLFDKPFDLDDLRTIALNMLLGKHPRTHMPTLPDDDVSDFDADERTDRY